MITNTSFCNGKDRLVDLVTLSADDIDVRDIAYSLARIYRFPGSSSQPITVGEHSGRVAQIMQKMCYDDPWIQGLTHDFTEAFLGDMATPVKAMVPEFRALETKVDTLLQEVIGIPVHSRQLKAADSIALVQEALRYTETTWHKQMQTALSDTFSPGGKNEVHAPIPLDSRSAEHLLLHMLEKHTPFLGEK